jgi:adenylate kinase
VKVVILGGPGAGKSTQADRLSQHLQVPCLSTGDLLRSSLQSVGESRAAGITWADRAKVYVERGELVPDELMIAFIRDRLSQPPYASGWVLEGYPRTAFQAEELDFLLDSLNHHLDWAIWLDVPETTLRSRCQGRSRPDDEPTILERRLHNLEEYTSPLLDYYGHQKRLLRINGEGDPNAITQMIMAQV